MILYRDSIVGRLHASVKICLFVYCCVCIPVLNLRKPLINL